MLLFLISYSQLIKEFQGNKSRESPSFVMECQISILLAGQHERAFPACVFGGAIVCSDRLGAAVFVKESARGAIQWHSCCLCRGTSYIFFGGGGDFSL